MLPQVDPIGRVYTAPGGTPVSWNAGVGYTATGQICTTLTAGPNDTYNGAWRLDPLGRVVVVVLAPPTVFNGGLPFNSNGALDGQPNATPIASDPYVRGMRVGPLGVYGTTAAIP
jgi:hypothetical protein